MLYAAFEEFLTVDQVRSNDNCGCITAVDPPDATIQDWIDQASDIIAIVSGYVVAGRRASLLRPCRVQYECHCFCGCELDGIPLGDETPVVTEVKIDGDVLDPDSYELHPSRIGYSLVRVSTDSTRPPNWPTSQHLWAPDTEDNTFSIAITEGFHVEQWVIEQAAMEIVCDFASEDASSMDELEEGITSATLGGVTVTVDPDRMARVRTGAFGPKTARLMGIFAPQGRAQSAVWAPELEPWNLNPRIPVVVGS